MKKIFFILVAAALIIPLASSAQGIKKGEIPDAGALGINPGSPVESVSGAVNILSAVVRWVYTIFFILTILFVLMAAYKYLTKADDAEKLKEARQQIVYAAVAVIIALLAVGFQAIIKNFLVSPTAGLSNTNALPAPQGSPDTGWTPDQYNR